MPASTALPTPVDAAARDLQAEFSAEVRRGLTRTPRSLSPWLFYDDRGSRLFEEITQLPEYYLTRTERALFAEHGDAIIAAAAEPETGQAGSTRLIVVELGAGTAVKTGLLLSAAVRRQGSVAYYPIDVSASALDAARQHLEQALPGVRVYPRVADYTDGLGRVDGDEQDEQDEQEAPHSGNGSLPHRLFQANGNGTARTHARKLVLYIGSSIGNFEPAAATRLLCGVRAQLRPGDRLLIGADRAPHARKSAELLLAAYDDAAGVTAAFNKNLLVRINRELDADFDADRFRHVARWNAAASRIEMYLESLAEQQVVIGALDLQANFARGEMIHTENSYKFTEAGLRAMLATAGFAAVAQWQDAGEWFGVCLASAI